MYSKVMILIWERWQRTRWAVIAACLLPLSGRLTYLVGFNAVIVTKIFIVLTFILLTLVLLVGHCETRDVDLAFPKRLFRFPVRTTTLLSVYMGYGVAAVALPSLILFGFEKLFLDSINYRWTNLLKLETVYIVLQTFFWLVGTSAFLRLALTLTGVYVLLEFTDRYILSMTSNILCPIIILLCGAISFWCVSAYRHGAWINGRQWPDSFLGMFRKRPSRPFESPLHAQVWFELRKAGHLFPIVSLWLIGLILGWMVIYGTPPRFSLVVPVMIISTVLSALIAGFIAFAVYHRDHVSGASSFWLRLPMATRTLAVARMHAMARSLARVIAILTIVALAVAAHDWARGTLDIDALSPVKWPQTYSSQFEIVTITILGLYGWVLVYWILLRLAPLLEVGGIVVFNISWLIKLLIGDVAFLWVWDTLTVGLPLGVLGAFYVARRRNLITTGTLVISACVFPLVVVSLWPFPWWDLITKGLSSPHHWQIIYLISAATLPFIPVVVSPLLMERLRHR